MRMGLRWVILWAIIVVLVVLWRKVLPSPLSEFQVSPKSCETVTLLKHGITRLAREVVDADALHCPHCRVKRRDDRSAFFANYQVTDQIKAVNVSCARLIEHRAIAVEGNVQRVQEV